jgi:DNA-binding NtrC family response regulator
VRSNATAGSGGSGGRSASTPSRPRILVVDDDPIAAESLADHLGEEGFDAATALGGDEALKLLEAASTLVSASGPPRPFAVALCDLSMPGLGGLELLRRIGKEYPETVVVMLTGYGTIESAVEALRMGATDYLTKPVVDTELKLSLERALRQHALVSENRTLKGRLEERFGLDQIVGRDHRMQKVYELIEAVAPSRTTVLMNGESGVGKSLVANAIHQQSPRRHKPFVQLSCGSIPETLLESELFGHVKGAFTGAHVDKVGRFLAADGGTLFLDEINSASPGMQLKLLRVLQEKRFEPVGSTQTIESDVRVILATNKPLEDLVARGEFRQDLYYRINVVQIDLPPLRERPSDIPVLAAHFLEKHGKSLGRTFTGFSPEAMELLLKYAFPGNVRELENVVERATVLSRTPTIGVDSLPPQVIGGGQPVATALKLHVPAESESPWVPMALEDALREPEKRILLKALRANGWNRQKTADELRINRTTLYKKMKLLGIEGDERLAG